MRILCFIFFLSVHFSFSTEWKIKESPHFIIYYEGKWTPGHIILETEQIFSNMKMNMSMFAPWMLKEKTKIFIYSKKENYIKGEFSPPQWSKGLAFSDKKMIVIYDLDDNQKLKATISHELTHLYFESYFAQNLKYPPLWLNEGLAVFMEDMAYPDEGPWKKALKYTNKDSYLPFDKFFRIGLDQLSSSQEIANWYLQAYGIVLYLYGPGKKLLFKNFCELERKKDTLEKNLWQSYRIRDLEEFEAKWKIWLDNFSKEKKEFSFSQPSASFDNFKLIEFKPIIKNKEK